MEDQLKDFNEMYARDVLPILAELEPLRHQKLQEYKKIKLFWQFMMIIPGVLFILIFTAFMLDLISYSYAFLATFILLTAPFSAIKYIEHTKSPKAFQKLIKDKCMPYILHCFKNIKWQNFKIDNDLLIESGLFSGFYQVRTDDFFVGKYNNTLFQVEEAHLLLSDDKYADGATVFRGVIINFPANKPVKSQTIVSSKNDSEIINTQFRANDSIIMFSFATCIYFIMLLHEIKSNQNYVPIIILLLIWLIPLTWFIYDRNRKLKRYQKVNLEDIGFDKRFAVHSKDQIEARYLVTPAFMERMKNLQTAFGTKDIKCSFYGDKIMFAIASDKDLFEIGDLFTPMTDSNQIYQLRAELTSIYKMIDYFKLAEKTGL